MTSTPPPTSPSAGPQRPMSGIVRPPRSGSRMSMSSRAGGSRASDDEAKTSVKVGMSTDTPYANEHSLRGTSVSDDEVS